jgi:Leu/Phe-tRNA-protein transferase
MGYLKTIKEAKELLAQHAEFTTGTLSARYEDGVYCVYSYAERIAWIDTYHTWITDKKFSQTTSKHSNLVRKAWGLN